MHWSKHNIVKVRDIWNSETCNFKCGNTTIVCVLSEYSKNKSYIPVDSKYIVTGEVVENRWQESINAKQFHFSQNKPVLNAK